MKLWLENKPLHPNNSNIHKLIYKLILHGFIYHYKFITIADQIK